MNEKKIHQVMALECNVTDCKYWSEDAQGCANPSPQMVVLDGHESGHFAEAICLTCENEPARFDPSLSRDVSEDADLRRWNHRPGAHN